MTQSHDDGRPVVTDDGEKLDRNDFLPLVHHGNTRAAWVGSAIALVGFVVAGVGFILPGGITWTVIFAGLGIVLLSAVVGLILRNLGHGTREDLLPPKPREH